MTQSSTAGGAARDALYATGDVLAAFASAGFVVSFPLAVAVDLLGGPVPDSVVPAAAVVAGVTGAYVFVAGRPPLAKLTDFALAAVLGLVAYSSLAFLVVAALGGLETGSVAHTATRVSSVVVAYAVGTWYVIARQRGHANEPAGGERSA